VLKITENKNLMIDALKLIGVAAVSSLVFTITNTPQTSAQTPTTEQSTQNRQVDRRYNLSFEYRGCQRARNGVACDVIVTNFTNTHRKVSFGARYLDYQTRATDTQGNVYISEGLQLNSSQKGQERVLIDLPPGIPTKLAFNFRIPSQVTELSAIDLGYLTVGRIDTIGRITITNVGSISTQSNTAKR
jgi:hypothetical protein